MPSMFIPFPRIQFEKFFQNKLFSDSAVSYHTLLVAACYFIHAVVLIIKKFVFHF